MEGVKPPPHLPSCQATHPLSKTRPPITVHRNEHLLMYGTKSPQPQITASTQLLVPSLHHWPAQPIQCNAMQCSAAMASWSLAPAPARPARQPGVCSHSVCPACGQAQ
jgi:hypothetical protein